MLGPPGIDGKFGRYTESAVLKFQKDNHLKKLDGVAGRETWTAICKLLSPNTPTSMIENTNDLYRQLAFEQETPTEVETQSETESTSPHIEEFEDDIPAINWEILLNETGSNLEANATEQIPP